MSSNKYAVFRLSAIRLGIPFNERQVEISPTGDILYALELADDGTGTIDPKDLGLGGNTLVLDSDGLRHIVKLGTAALYFDKDEDEEESF